MRVRGEGDSDSDYEGEGYDEGDEGGESEDRSEGERGEYISDEGVLPGAIAHNTIMTDLTLWRESGLNTLVRAMVWLGEDGSELVLVGGEHGGRERGPVRMRPGGGEGERGGRGAVGWKQRFRVSCYGHLHPRGKFVLDIQ